MADNAKRYTIAFVIRSFASKDTEALYNGLRIRRFAAIEKAARRKLAMRDAATVLQDLATPAGNKLESLKHERQGQHSIRVNDQYCVCFTWNGSDAENVEIVDYH